MERPCIVYYDGRLDPVTKAVRFASEGLRFQLAAADMNNMKRLIVLASLSALVGSAFAQSSFTIRRPLEGAKVRETVEVRIPVRSIPSGSGFVGIWVNGKFLEAVSPYYPATGVNTTASDFIYKLDTKKQREPNFPRGIPDGQMTIEAVLYANRGTFTQPINKSSVVVSLDNSASIRIPSGGIVLRYPFRPLTEFIYGVEFKNSIQSLTEAQAQLGSQAGTVDGAPEKFRYRMTVINDYRNRDGSKDGLLLMQPLTERGRDYAMLTIAGNNEPQKYYDYMMEPLYMRLANNGREVFGAWPIYAPSATSFGDNSKVDLVAVLPLPILPSRGVRPGGPAFTGYLPQAVIDLEKTHLNERFTQLVQARGTLEGIEYERGRPCAKIRNVLAQGQAATGVLEFNEYYWFALDLGMPIKIERTYTVTRRIRETVGSQSGGGRTPGTGGGGGTPPRQAGAGGGGGGRAGSQGGSLSTTPGLFFSDDSGLRFAGPGLIVGPSTWLRQRGPGNDNPEEGGQRVGGGLNSGGGGGGTGMGGGGGQRTVTRLVRQRTVITMIME